MQSQDPNPSAPPEEVDDFQWIENSMKEECKNNDNNNAYPVLSNNNNNANEPGFIQPQHMVIPDAISQQLIYQKIMEEQRRNKEEKNEGIIPKRTYKPWNDEKSEPAKQAKPSFISQSVEYPESALYKTSGICIWRRKENGKGIQFMMGLEKNSNALSWFGGKRNNKTDKECIDCAIRQFHEQTAKN